MTLNEQKQMYNDIMAEVARIVKSRLNELSLPTVSRAHHKSMRFSEFKDVDYMKYEKRIENFSLTQPILSFLNQVDLRIYSYVSYTQYTYDSEKNEEKEGYRFEVKYYNSENPEEYIEYGFRYVPEFSPSGIDFEVDEIHLPEDKMHSLCIENLNSSKISLWDTLMMMRKDAVVLQRMIKDETGIDISWRNFGISPDEFRSHKKFYAEHRTI